MDAQEEKPDKQTDTAELMQRIFGDFEARSNFVGLFDLLYKIDRRVNPHLYVPDGQQKL